MSLVRARIIGALAAAALLGLAGCQRADERAAATRDAGAKERNVGAVAGPRAGQDVARRQPGAEPSVPERQRDVRPAPADAKTAAAAPAGERPAGTADPGSTRAMGGPPSTSTQAMGAAERVDDRSITRQVSAAIAADQQLRAMRIDVDTQNGIVTLSGPAPTVTVKEHAGEVARTIHGVISVNNQLTLASG